MRFGPNVVEHAPFSIPMIGNTATGYSIGLTPEGAAVCHRMFSEDVTEAEVAAVHADLPAHLLRGGFVVEDVEADDVTLGERRGRRRTCGRRRGWECRCGCIRAVRVRCARAAAVGVPARHPSL